MYQTPARGNCPQKLAMPWPRAAARGQGIGQLSPDLPGRRTPRDHAWVYAPPMPGASRFDRAPLDD